MIRKDKNINRYVIKFGKCYVSEDGEGLLSLTKDKSIAMVFKTKGEARKAMIKHLNKI